MKENMKINMLQYKIKVSLKIAYNITEGFLNESNNNFSKTYKQFANWLH